MLITNANHAGVRKLYANVGSKNEKGANGN